MKPRLTIVTLGVTDMRRSIRFYRDGLGFPTTTSADDASWAIFRTGGSRLALYPRTALAGDIGPACRLAGEGFGGITLAHSTDTREEVDAVIAVAIAAGGTLLKRPQPALWGGYSGYFADPDGYPWEVAWAEGFVIDELGLLWGGALGKP